MKISVDGKEIDVSEERTLLQACLDEGVYVPNLCCLPEMKNPPASCRLCFVEIEGESRPVSACKTRPKEGMVVRTDTDVVRRLQRSALRLLLSVHRVECKVCPSNRKCELQRMAKLLGVRLKPRRFRHIDRDDLSAPAESIIEYNANRCVLCGKCVYVCEQRNGHAVLTFAKRGFDTIVTSYGAREVMDASVCFNCRACIDICPVSAISLKNPASDSA